MLKQCVQGITVMMDTYSPFQCFDFSVCCMLTSLMQPELGQGGCRLGDYSNSQSGFPYPTSESRGEIFFFMAFVYEIPGCFFTWLGSQVHLWANHCDWESEDCDWPGLYFMSVLGLGH